MAQSVERSCTFLVAAEALPSPAEIKAALEDGDDRSRAAAMRAAVSGVLNGGEPIPGLFITIVRYVLPSEDHTVQKLLLLYLVRERESGKKERKRKKNDPMPLSRDGFFFFRLLSSSSSSSSSLSSSSPSPSFLPAHTHTHTIHFSSVLSTNPILQETIEKTDASGKLLPEMVRKTSFEGVLKREGEQIEQATNSRRALFFFVRPPLPSSQPLLSLSLSVLSLSSPTPDPHLPEPAQQPPAPQRVRPRLHACGSCAVYGRRRSSSRWLRRSCSASTTATRTSAATPSSPSGPSTACRAATRCWPTPRTPSPRSSRAASRTRRRGARRSRSWASTRPRAPPRSAGSRRRRRRAGPEALQLAALELVRAGGAAPTRDATSRGSWAPCWRCWAPPRPRCSSSALLRFSRSVARALRGARRGRGARRTLALAVRQQRQADRAGQAAELKKRARDAWPT